jgi:hypothetical protein
LAVVVLLPTPPLPDETAMMFFTPGSSCTPRCTACEDLGGDVDRDIAHARHSPGRSDELAAQLGMQALGRIAHFHIERDVVTGNLQVAQGAGAHKVLASVRIKHGGQRAQKRLFCSHWI